MERELDSLHYRFQSAVDKDELAALVYPGVCDSQTRTVSVEFARFLQILNMRGGVIINLQEEGSDLKILGNIALEPYGWKIGENFEVYEAMERDLNSLLSQEKRWESLLSKLLTVAKIFDRTNASAYIPISWVFDKESKSYAILDSRPFFELHKTFENLIGHSQKFYSSILGFIDDPSARVLQNMILGSLEKHSLKQKIRNRSALRFSSLQNGSWNQELFFTKFLESVSLSFIKNSPIALNQVHSNNDFLDESKFAPGSWFLKSLFNNNSPLEMNSMSVDVCTESKFRVAILEHVAVIIKSKKMPREYILFADRMIRNIDMDSLKMEDFVKEKKSFSKILLELCDIIHSSKNVEEPRLLSINAFKVLKAINFKTHSLTILHWFYLFLSLPSTKAKELPADYELSLDLLEKIVMSGNLASIQDDIVYGAAVAISILKDRGSECKDYITRLIHDLSIYTPRIEQIHLDIENILKGVRCPSKQNSIQLKRNLATFSQDILVAIFDFCDCLDKLRFTEICKHFHRTLSSQNAWKELNLSSASPASIPYSFLSKHNGSKSLKILNLTFQNLSQDLLSDLIDSCSSLKTIVLDFAFLTSHQTLKDNNGLKTKILATSLTYFSMRSLRSSEKISCALITPNLKHLNASDVSRSKCMPFVIELCSSSTCLEDVYLNNSFSSDIPLHIFYGSLQSLKKFYVNFGSPRVNSGLDNTSLRKIITCSPNLRELGVCMNSQLTDTAFSESVAYFSRLEILELGWIYDISEESLLSLSAVLRNLRSLNLCRIPSVSNTVVRSFIENCPTLRILNIRMCDHVSDEAFEGLTRFSSAPNLRTIVIEGTRVNSFRLQEKGFVCY